MNRVILAVCVAVAVGVFLTWDLVQEELETSHARQIDPTDVRSLHDVATLRAWMVDNAEHVSLVAWSLDTNGEVLPSGVTHNADVARPAGTLAFLPLAIPWAKDVPMQSPAVALGEWEAWWLPGSPEAYGHVDEVRLAGAVPLGTGRVSEFDIVSAMIRSSDPSAADWLRHRVGSETPSPMLGVALAGPRHDAPDAAITGTSLEERESLARQYIDDSVWRRAEQDWRGRPHAERTWEQGQRLEGLWPTMEAGELSALLAKVATIRGQRGPYARVSEMMMWPLGHPGFEDYERFGGARFAAPGLVVEAAFAHEEGRPTRLVVLMMRGLAFRPWSTLVKSNAHQELVRELLDDPDLAVAVGNAL